MKILFMGTPDFALFSLKGLCENGYNVVGVITQPDKPKGRGYVLTPPFLHGIRSTDCRSVQLDGEQCPGDSEPNTEKAESPSDRGGIL